MSYTNSKTWHAPDYRAKKSNGQMNFARKKLCRSSPFWPENMDIQRHMNDWKAGERLRHKRRLEREEKELKNCGPPTPISRAPFDGKVFKENFSNILSFRTIFCPQWLEGKDEVSPWPSKAEMDYEGDSRIATDRLHRRFPGAPRVESHDTTNWQHKAVIEQYPFDDFYYPIPNAVDIFLRMHSVGELEFSKEEGEAAIGSVLMGLLDPQEQFI